MRYIIGAVAIITACATCVPTELDLCLEYGHTLVDYSGQPDAQPTTRRAMALELLTWQGGKYLLLNTGDGLRLYDNNNSLHPRYLAGREYVCSYCPAQEPGDHDWVQYNVSFCDDCRYAVSHFWQAGLALLDLGTGLAPDLPPLTGPTIRYYEAPSDAQGAFTFRHGSQQYLALNDLREANEDDFAPGSCGHRATLWQVDGTEPSDLTEISCVEPTISVTNGLYLTAGSDAYLYLIDRPTSRVHIFSIAGSGADLSLQYLGAPMHAGSKFGRGIRADQAAGLLVTAVQGTPSARLWDISDPGQPMVIAELDGLLGTTVSRAAIRYPVLWLGKNAGLYTATFNIRDPTDPRSLDTTFWEADRTWNSQDTYPHLANADAEISIDGMALYLARYSMAAVIDTQGCNRIVSDGFESGDLTAWNTN